MKLKPDALFEQIHPIEQSRAQKRKAQILNAAIELYAKIGFEQTTYEKIAESCGVTRPLIIHYFPNKQDLFDLVVKYIRANLQKMAVEDMLKETSSLEQLKAYLKSTFRWVSEYPTHAKIWLYFYYMTSIDKKLRETNTHLVNVGHERLMALLEIGVSEGVFVCNDYSVSAKAIQNLLTGSLLCALTEDIPSVEKLRDQTIKKCIALIRA